MSERYQWPPPRDVRRTPKNRHPFHSLITALPLLMLLIGLGIYFQRESAQQAAEPIESEAREVSGSFGGTSVAGSGALARHFLWLSGESGERGIRISEADRQALQALEPGVPVTVLAAPTVAGSNTLWMLNLRQADGQLIRHQPPQSGE